MPYEVTASRKRPKTFEELAGQEFVAATLEKSLETGRIAHAYLFSGPRGCGKTSTARILAKALNCEKGPTPSPCGVCDSCRSIASGSSLDVIEIDGASNTSVDNVRQIKDEVLFPPNAARYKIYIIDEVHMLSISAFNALLKTIEEPPPYVVFMFATTEQHKVPATIKSRCQQFTFRLVAPEIVVRLLAEAAGEMGIETEAEALLWIARESGGSIRDAYTLFDQIVSFAEGRVTAALIREKLGLVGQDRMNALFAKLSSGDTSGALTSLDDILVSGVSAEQFVADVVEYCRALLLIKNGLTKESLLGAPLSSFDLSIPESLSGERIEWLLSVFLGAYRFLKESIDPRYELDLAVAKASRVKDYVAPSELSEAVAAARRQVEALAAGAAPPPTRQPVPSAPRREFSRPAAPAREDRREAPAPYRAERSADAADASEGTRPGVPDQERSRESRVNPEPAGSDQGRVAPDDLDSLRKAVVADVRRSNVLLATTLEKSGRWSLDDSMLVIPAASRMEHDLLRRFTGIIAELVASRTGVGRQIDITLAQASPKGSAGSAPARMPNGATDPQAESAGGVPELSEAERNSIGMVERYFKGSMKGFSAAGASALDGAADRVVTSAGSRPLADSRTDEDLTE